VTLVVTNTNNSGQGSLRESLTVANATPGNDVVTFAIPDDVEINLTSPLPPLTDDAGVTIDGYTQPGASPNTLASGNNAVLRIEISGAQAGAQAIGIDIRSAANVVRGLVINRFDRLGIAVERGAGNRIVGCFVGTDSSGSQASPNRAGIAVFFNGKDPNDPAATADTVIGSPAPADRNLVSGNFDDGIALGIVSTSTTIQNNYIGTNADGVAAVPNGGTGVNVVAPGTSVGGAAPGAGNLISGNAGLGVALSFLGANLVQGNLIGTDVSGTRFIPNSTGVRIFNSQSNTIGGSAPGARNVIAGNLGTGVQIFGSATTSNALSRNLIHDNGRLGIDLEGDGVSPNDLGDGDGGPNLLQNFPVLKSASREAAGSTRVEGTLNSTPLTTFQVEFFSNEACDPSGAGEGSRFLGSMSVTTDASGNSIFTATNLGNPGAGRVVAATATDPNGNTSEFSACMPIGEQFFPLVPCRAVDTRNPAGPLGGPALAAQSGRTFGLVGACGIPISARSVAVNLTVTQAASPGYLTIHPPSATIPLASSINFSIGKTRSNNAILRLSMDGAGSVVVENASPDTVQFILDVSGYFE
jgi:trimeric autotransporter adhesin